jgi:hypothetical protein
MTAAEIRELVEGLVAILQSATTEDLRKIYEAAQLSITYDHSRKMAKLHSSPGSGMWSSVCVGGASLTQSTRAPWAVELVAT